MDKGIAIVPWEEGSNIGVGEGVTFGLSCALGPLAVDAVALLYYSTTMQTMAHGKRELVQLC